MTIRTIHLGVGGRGAWPLRQIPDRDDFESVALVDVNAKSLTAAREVTGLGPEACFHGLGDALEAVGADAVVIITPPDMHARQCLGAGGQACSRGKALHQATRPRTAGRR